MWSNIHQRLANTLHFWARGETKGVPVSQKLASSTESKIISEVYNGECIGNIINADLNCFLRLYYNPFFTFFSHFFYLVFMWYVVKWLKSYCHCLSPSCPGKNPYFFIMFGRSQSHQNRLRRPPLNTSTFFGCERVGVGVGTDNKKKKTLSFFKASPQGTSPSNTNKCSGGQSLF